MIGDPAIVRASADPVGQVMYHTTVQPGALTPVDVFSYRSSTAVQALWLVDTLKAPLTGKLKAKSLK